MDTIDLGFTHGGFNEAIKEYINQTRQEFTQKIIGHSGALELIQWINNISLKMVEITQTRLRDLKNFSLNNSSIDIESQKKNKK